jgi:hypothetical protein
VLPAGRAEIPPFIRQLMCRRQASTLEDPLLRSIHLWIRASAARIHMFNLTGGPKKTRRQS